MFFFKEPQISVVFAHVNTNPMEKKMTMLPVLATKCLLLLLLLLSHFSRVRLCVIPQMAAHQAPPSLGFSRQEHWSGLPFPSPMHEREKWKWSHSVVSDSSRPHGLQPTRLLRPWDFPGKSTGVGCHRLLLVLIKWLKYVLKVIIRKIPVIISKSETNQLIY